jgi:hypothetical protein
LAHDGNNQERSKTKYHEEYQKFIANAHGASPMVAQGARLKAQGTRKPLGVRIKESGGLIWILASPGFWILATGFYEFALSLAP